MVLILQGGHFVRGTKRATIDRQPSEAGSNGSCRTMHRSVAWLSELGSAGGRMPSWNWRGTSVLRSWRRPVSPSPLVVGGEADAARPAAAVPDPGGRCPAGPGERWATGRGFPGGGERRHQGLGDGRRARPRYGHGAGPGLCRSRAGCAGEPGRVHSRRRRRHAETALLRTILTRCSTSCGTIRRAATTCCTLS